MCAQLISSGENSNRRAPGCQASQAHATVRCSVFENPAAPLFLISDDKIVPKAYNESSESQTGCRCTKNMMYK